MTVSVTLRPAMRQDAAELALLVDIASHGFAAWLWYVGVAQGATDTAFERGRNALRENDKPGAWQDAVVAEIDGEIAAAAIGYRLAGTIVDAVGDHAVLEPLLDLQRPLAEHWFVDSLGVYRHHRRQGLGRLLMQAQIEKAAASPVSLITESHNLTAQGLYAKMGFVEMAR